MNIIEHLKQFFGSGDNSSHESTHSIDIINYIASLVSNPSDIQSINEKSKLAQTLPILERHRRFVLIYREIVDYLVYKELVKKISEEQIKNSIRTHFKPKGLEGGLAILFMNESRGLLSIALEYLNEILRGASSVISLTVLMETVNQHAKQVGLNGLIGYRFGRVEVLQLDQKYEPIFAKFLSIVLSDIYNKLVSLNGEESAKQLYEQIYKEIVETYHAEVKNVRQIVSYLPNNLLASDRVSVLSRESLEEKLIEQTALLQKQLVVAANKNRELEDNKRAMLNLLEDAHALEEELRQEKENVEKKVEERTSALLEAKDEVSLAWVQNQQEKARLTASINSLSLGFIMTDEKGNVLISNPALSKILNLPGTWSLTDIASRMQGNINLLESLAFCIHQGKIVSTDKLSCGPTYLKLYMSPIISQQNKIIGTVILIEDVTNAKVLERSRDEFFSIASHELRTPLTSIKGNTSLIEQYYSEYLKDPSLKEMISDIHESSVRLIDIVNDFLDVSRLEQGRLKFKSEIFDIVPLIEKVLYDLKITANEKKIYVQFNHAADTHPFVMADSARTKQIIYNILGNAIKFTDKGGVTVDIVAQNGFLNIRITDTGKGIPVTSQALLFRKFQQAENNILTRDSTKGTGLGLYISKLIAGEMGGTIVLERSEEGKGSTFLIKLPLAQTTHAVASPQNPTKNSNTTVN